jgi:hypothetical protein
MWTVRSACCCPATSLSEPIADDTSVIIDALNPQILVEVTGEPALRDIADEVTRKIQAAINSLHTAPTSAKLLDP